jgi:hypothetical protein
LIVRLISPRFFAPWAALEALMCNLRKSTAMKRARRSRKMMIDKGNDLISEIQKMSNAMTIRVRISKERC